SCSSADTGRGRLPRNWPDRPAPESRDWLESFMQSHDVRVDITGRVDLEGELKTAATVHLPDVIDGPLTVLFGYPGGGYARGYYDIRRLRGYSQAEHHISRGFAFVACDHI